MRIISQDGTIDIPYENFVFGITQDNFIVAIRDTVARPSEVCQGIVAEYSSKEKAQKAMDMLRTAYVGLPILFQNVDMNESIVDKLKEWKRDGIVLLHDNADSKIEQVNNAIFQFPQDEDVEV